MRYIFPTYCGFSGGYDDAAPDVALNRARAALLMGEPLLLLDAVQKKASPEVLRQIRDIVTLKRSVDPLLYGARFRDNIGLSTSDAVKANAFVAPDRIYVTFLRRYGRTRDLHQTRKAWREGPRRVAYLRCRRGRPVCAVQGDKAC